MVIIGAIASVLTIMAVLFPQMFVNSLAEVLRNQNSMLSTLEQIETKNNFFWLGVYGNSVFVELDSPVPIEIKYMGFRGTERDYVYEDLRLASRIVSSAGSLFFEFPQNLGRKINYCIEFEYSDGTTVVDSGLFEVLPGSSSSDEYTHLDRRVAAAIDSETGCPA